MITSIVPFSIVIQANNYTEWCIVCELLENSVIVLNIAIKLLPKGEISSVNICLSRKRETSDIMIHTNERKREREREIEN